MAHLAGKYLTFALGNEEYGIGILKVKEIIGIMPIVQVPQVPDHVKGVINLRGKVIPIVDLRRRFDMDCVDYTEKSCIIVIEGHASNMMRCWEAKQCGKLHCPAFEAVDRRCWMIAGTHCRDEIQGSAAEKKQACKQCDVLQKAQAQNVLFVQGIVVDSVTEVLPIKEDDIEVAPALGSQIDTEYILGMAKSNDNVKILLNIDKILSPHDISNATLIEGSKHE